MFDSVNASTQGRSGLEVGGGVREHELDARRLTRWGVALRGLAKE